MADIHSIEEVDGIRMSWNIWPNSRLEATKCVVPFGALYTPLRQLPHMPVVEYEPVPCKSCGAILNPFVNVDYNARIWICPFCHTRNHVPPHYAGISPTSMPAELFESYTTIEYTLQPQRPVHPPAYVFVVDTCVSEEELAACRGAINQALQMVPETAHVGLVTFGTHVHVHELGFAECPKSYVFRGSKDYTIQQVQDQLGVGSAAAALAGGPRLPAASPGKPGMAPGMPPVARFIPTLSDCEFVISGVLEELQRDAFPTVTENRPARCTGTALQVTAGLMAACLPVGCCAARMMLFVGGPSTEGQGKVVDKELSEPIRSHKDLAKDSAPHFAKARKFYEQLAAQLQRQGHSLDVFACALEQVGLAEMRAAVEQSGGSVVLTDTFTSPVFKESLKRIFAEPGKDGHLGMASNATFEVIPSRDVKVSGVLGPAAPVEKKSPAVADISVGLGGTTTWRLAGLDHSTTLAVFFEIVASNKEQQPAASSQFYVQFLTKYLHESGQWRQRVTTITRGWVDASEPQAVQQLIQGFDQEAAAALMARLACHKMETEEDFDATRWLDRQLIRLAARFGDFRQNDPESFSLQEQLSFYPQFMFNLRRSQFVQAFGNSPDETAYCRLQLNKETVTDALIMIQPSLMSFGIEGQGQAEPVLLDVGSIQPDRILLLDSYFYVVIFHGTTIAQWRKAEYQLDPNHVAFKELLEAPQRDAEDKIKYRYPVPKLVDCDQNGSQARFLLAKLNPSATYTNAPATSSEVILTDDVSLSVFTEHLKKLAVEG